MIGQGMHGFVENKELVITDIDKALHEPTDTRIFVISKAFRAGYTIDQIHELAEVRPVVPTKTLRNHVYLQGVA
ncbi:MAG: hypothetical protein ACLR6J_12555 [Parabacteroides merdae]